MIMTDTTIHATDFATRVTWRVRLSRVATQLHRWFYRAMVARHTRYALEALPDWLIRDIGLTRDDIAFAADAIASAQGDPGNDATHRADQVETGHRATAGRLPRVVFYLALAVQIAAALLSIGTVAALAQNAQIDRGKYLVGLGGCNDCHTPGYFFGKPDMTRFLGGSEVGFEIPDLGVFHGPNLTPDRETGLGTWSAEEIATAITKGQRPDGRILAPIMPWHAFANLTRQDVQAIAAFLKSLPPIKNQVPGPFGSGEKPSSFVMKIVPPEAAATGGSASK
jgi:mono/diheme cytochrome c family protein/uncharacterized protein YjiS (DUF1127 family)